MAYDYNTRLAPEYIKRFHFIRALGDLVVASTGRNNPDDEAITDVLAGIKYYYGAVPDARSVIDPSVIDRAIDDIDNAKQRLYAARNAASNEVSGS